MGTGAVAHEPRKCPENGPLPRAGEDGRIVGGELGDLGEAGVPVVLVLDIELEPAGTVGDVESGHLALS